MIKDDFFCSGAGFPPAEESTNILFTNCFLLSKENTSSDM